MTTISARSHVSKAALKTENRTIKAHPKLIMDTIQRQAGTLSKAILEGVMNSVDAGAACCYIDLELTRVRILDQGKGIQTRREIEEFFETFGTPHDESEGKVYGQFRMGRGQLFAFGRNRWRTGQFEMCLDVKEQGLDYELTSGMEVREGCEVEVEFYETLTFEDEAMTRRDLANWCRYAPIPVYLGEELLTVDPNDENWTEITEEAYIRISRTSQLEVHNLGIYACSPYHHTYGTGGVVVSRKQLKLNYARNDIMSDCLVWREIRKVLSKHAQVEARRADQRGLADSQASWRRQLLRDMLLAKRWDTRHDAMLGDWPSRKLFSLTSGRKVSAEELACAQRLSFGDKGDRRADRGMQLGLALVLDRLILDEFKVKGTREFFMKLRELLELQATVRPGVSVEKFDKLIAKRAMHVTLDKLLEGFENDAAELIPREKLSKLQQLWLEILRLMQNGAESAAYAKRERYTSSGASINDFSRPIRRELHIGKSELNDGWTDGSHLVAVDWRFLQKRQLTTGALTELAHLLIHEWCHDTADIVTHEHGVEFYQQFHDMAFLAGYMVAKAQRMLLQPARRKKLSVTQVRQLSK